MRKFPSWSNHRLVLAIGRTPRANFKIYHYRKKHPEFESSSIGATTKVTSSDAT